MTKKIITTAMALSLAFFSFISCGKQPASPKAGTASADDLLRLFPEDAKGVVFIDINRAMQTEIVNKSIQEDENYTKYQEFIEKTGIDPQKDIYCVAIVFSEEIKHDEAESKAKMNGAAILNLKFNKEVLITLLKAKAEEEEKEILEEDYNGLGLYAWEKGDMVISFIDDSNILVGDSETVKSIIDVMQEKKENIFNNENLSSLINDSNKKAILWGAFLISPETVNEVKSGNPMLSNLEGINAILFNFNYKNKSIVTEIKVMNDDEVKNKQVAELLSGIKALGAMVATEKPTIGELLDKIEISSGPTHVKISANIPEEMIETLKQEMGEKED